jgi:DNA-directed RNA polymerase specialized sigma24 family protein
MATGAVDDVVSETWAAALTKIGRFTADSDDGDDGGFCRWLMGIARHRVLRVARVHWLELPAGATAAEDVDGWLDRAQPVNGASGPTEVDPARQQMSTLLREAINGLPEEHQAVVRMRLDGVREVDIVRETG